jgi:Mg2+ and Co2+ transporter CorA
MATEKPMIQRLIETKIPLTSLLGWLFAVIGLTFTISSAYGEQKQKLEYLTDRQARIEQVIERTESLVRRLNESVIRLESQIQQTKRDK